MTITNDEKSSVAGYKKVTHCVFDMDGLLLDTEKIHLKIIQDLAKKYNTTYPWEVRMKILGTTEKSTAEIAVREMKLPCTADDFRVQFKEQCLIRLENVVLIEGAERLIRHLHKNKIPFCLATSSSNESAEVKTRHHRELFSLFNHQVKGSSDPDVKEGKPAPDIFLVAAERFPDIPDPAKCLVFEDAPNGCRAAKSAGMQVVMVPDPLVTEDQRKDATVVYKSLLDFKPELFGLPPFTD